MIVVSDTTPLISLMKVSLLDILHSLFGEIRIPEAVYDELTINERYASEADQIRNSSFIKRVTVQDKKTVMILRNAAGLDIGESEAITYAENLKAAILLMDEARGRKVAKSLDIPIMGTVGVLLSACRQGILGKSEVEAALDGLVAANCRIGKDVVEAAKRRLNDM
ncbi:MAG: DUF3368 domain-containing protein [Clostridia bacterium]|nr:DUF3368 domain-containing protein [Clostridia bacterium]